MRHHAIVAGLAALLAAPATAQVVPGPPVPPDGTILDGTILDVSAEGRSTRVPDIATIRAGVVTQAPTAAAALADNSARMARVLAALKRAVVADRDVQTSSVGLSPQYRYVENQPPAITGYQATNTVAIRFRDIARSGAILDALVNEGANQIDGPALSIDKPDAAFDEARADAVRRARARAELYARAAGLGVVRILAMAESGANAGGGPPPMLYARAQRGESADTSVVAGERDVTVTLSVRFLLR